MSQKKKLNWKLLTVLAAAFVIGLISYRVESSDSPFPPWMQKYFGRSRVPLGHDAARRAKALYDVAVHQAANSSNGLGVYLPANAVITRSWYYVKTATTGNPNARVAFQCEDSGNIKTATDMTSYNANEMIEGASTGASSAFKTGIAAACEITAVLTGGIMSTGAIEIYVDYVVHD